MELITRLWHFLRDSYADTYPDPRTKDWILVKHVWVAYAIIGVWLCFILSLGPKYMKDRKPYSLKSFIYYYNIFQIIYNSWIVYASIKNGLFTEFGLGCALIDRSHTGKPVALVNVFFWATLLKIIDLVETIIFVLRKKDRQISFLHLYHHVSTIYVTLTSLWVYPGGAVIVPIATNSSVHVVMYAYYLLSSQGPRAQRLAAPIKPYITLIQLVQFLFLLAHTIQGFAPSCQVPKWGTTVLFANLMINFLLFYHFYQTNYIKNRKEKVK